MSLCFVFVNCFGHLILTVWRNVWADWSPRSTRIWALGFITRSVPSENIVMWENNLLNSSLLCSISWGRSGKYYGINLYNLVFLASFMSCFSWESDVHCLLLFILCYFPFICFVSAAAVGCCTVSSGNLALSLPRGSALVSFACDDMLWTESVNWASANKTYFAP